MDYLVFALEDRNTSIPTDAFIYSLCLAIWIMRGYLSI